MSSLFPIATLFLSIAVVLIACQQWFAKNDASPKDASAIQSVTSSDIFNRKGPTEPLTHHSGRLDIENKWFAFTGLVVVLAFSAPKGR
jgi:hypothetical protein